MTCIVITKLGGDSLNAFKLVNDVTSEAMLHKQITRAQIE